MKLNPLKADVAMLKETLSQSSVTKPTILPSQAHRLPQFCKGREREGVITLLSL